jgi:hypothetical protein
MPIHDRVKPMRREAAIPTRRIAERGAEVMGERPEAWGYRPALVVAIYEFLPGQSAEMLCTLG